MRPYFLFLFMVLATANIAHAQNTSGKQDYKDSLIYAKVQALPEVVHITKTDEQLHKRTKMLDGNNYIWMSRYHLIMKARPSADAHRYWIQVLQSKSPDHFPNSRSSEVVYNFFVYPNNNTVRYYDAAKGTTLSLNDWRKSKLYKVPKI